MSLLKKILSQFFYITLLTCGLLFLSAQTPQAREYQVKAVFLFNFSQFVEWPASAFSSAKAPLVIGILGQDHFGTFLDETVSNEQVNGHPLVIQRYQNIEEAKACHILFISPEELNKLGQIPASLKGQNILTVSDAPNFIQQGGMIRFLTINNKIHFQINPDAAKNSGLVISSKLLRLAEIVIPNKKK